MSVFWQHLSKFEGQSRSQQMEQLKVWSAEMAKKVPAEIVPADTKPAKPNYDIIDVENNTVGNDGPVSCSDQVIGLEQLKTLQQDNAYIEELLHIRDSTVFKYLDLYGG